MSSRLLCVATLVLAVVLGSTAQGVVIVMKEGSALTTGGALNSAFSGVTAANVVQVAVDDMGIISNSAAYYATQGNIAKYSASSFNAFLWKFDLSSLPAGATIEKAQIRLYTGNGNTGMKFAPVVTHNWNEAISTRASYNGLASPNKNWGPASNEIFTGADLGTVSNADSCPAGAAFTVEDVTADVQAMVNGTMGNYGWALFSSLTGTALSGGNHDYYASENTDDGRRPALFISYTPEPATLVLLALSAMALLRRRAA